ncbi:MAG: bifunctional adenosylcobinamide kinase/adenosylcobinamide-phosphate guanylyltransferase [Candidatus Omnitrophica bacterium]|nr:bifunctional adenosylcobinamide kinase/adenosylcobinamide-phosphate guanylyltransferase [Candidatus Omnitrophota bacterium]
MNNFTFIFGGARSGKSSHAVKMAKALKKKTAFIATCTFKDGEMKRRIGLHKKSRPQSWKIIEEGVDLKRELLKLESKYKVILIDCLGLFVSNLMEKNLTEPAINKEIKALTDTILKVKANIIVVSNDVGSGIIPDNKLARTFRDLLGFANQQMAKKADNVIFMQVGIPNILKGGKDGFIK